MNSRLQEGIRVLHVLHALGEGGAERRISEMLVYARGKGEQWGMAYLSEPSQPLRPYLEAGGVPVIGPLSSSRRSLGNIARILQAAREFGTQLIHTHDTWPGIWTKRPRTTHGGAPAHVHTQHGFDLFGKLGRIKPWIYKWAIFRRADWLVWVSEADRRFAAALTAEVAGKSTVIYNGIDQARLQRQKTDEQVRSELGIAADQPLICAVANLRPKKGHEVAIRAMSLVREKFPGAVLVIAGGIYDVGLHNRLQELIANLELQASVKILGLRNDVPDLLGVADLFVMSSYFEGLPGAVQEAALMGCPVVATTAGGIPEIIQHGETGLLVPPGDVKALAEAIVQLLSDRELARQFAQRAQEYAQRHFTVHGMYLGHRQLYEDLMKERLECGGP